MATDPAAGSGAVVPAPTAVVVGGGISGLLAARELARAGVRTTVLEASAEWGGCVGSHVVAGLTLDSGAESFATRSTAVANLAEDLGLGPEIVPPNPGGAWVQLPEGPRELPKTGVLGIPANPWDPEVRRSLGLWGSLRASLDAVLPPTAGTSSAGTSVAALVRTRMGRRVLERLVAPVVGGVHSADPALLDVDMVAPGLRAGIRAQGSLAAAVAAQRRGPAGAGRQQPTELQQTGERQEYPRQAAGQPGPSQPGPAKAGSAVAGLRGGMHTLIAALLAELRGLDVSLLSSSRADTVERLPGGWRVTAGNSRYQADRLVVAIEGPAAVDLLAGTLPALESLRPETGPDVRLVTLVLDRPALDAAPRGTGVLVAPQSPGVLAKALTHATAKWAWLADRTVPGRHVLRLSYGRGGDEPAAGSPEPRSDAELFDAALRDASALLGVPLSATDVVDWDVVRWSGALPFATLGHRQRVDQVRRLCAAEGNLAVVGGWLSGNGLAAIVADTPQQVASLLP